MRASRWASHGLLTAVLVIPSTPAPAAAVVVSSGDGLSLALDDANGSLTGLYLDFVSVRDPGVFGGLYVRDRQRLLEVPPTARNLFPNPSFELDANTDGIPDGWTFQDGYGRGASVSMGPDAFQGARSVTIEDYAGGAIVALVAVGPETRYVIQAMVKGTVSYVVVVWLDDTESYIFASYGAGHRQVADWTPLHHEVMSPDRAAFAEVRFYSAADADLTLDMARIYEAPPAAFAPIQGTVSAAGGVVVQTGSVPALSLDFRATYTGATDHIAIDVVLTDTSGTDRALDAGFIAPVQARWWHDNVYNPREVTQLSYAQTFQYSTCGGTYVDNYCTSERSVHPFAAVSLGGGYGLAMGYDVSGGPQDVEFFHSTDVGNAFMSEFRLGIAPEPVLYPGEARFRLMLYRIDGDDAFRSAIEGYQAIEAPVFENRLPAVGGWAMWYSPWDMPAAAADFGINVHTYDNDVGRDDTNGVQTYVYVGSFDHFLDLGDYVSQPSQADAVDRLNFNATDAGANPSYVTPSRASLVSSCYDPTDEPLLGIFNLPWMPGSGWSAITANNMDPDVYDRSGRGWWSRYDEFQDLLDSRLAAAGTAGATLEGAFVDWLRSNMAGNYNHRREHFETCDYPPSYDPMTLTPALPEEFSHWEAVREFTAQMHARGLVTLSRGLYYQDFWATAVIDGVCQNVYWDGGEDHDSLAYYRTLAGKKPVFLELDVDYAAYPIRHGLDVALLYGFFLTPNFDSGADRYYWDDPALVDRDRLLFKQYMALWRLQWTAGWEPRHHATTPSAAIAMERFGSRDRGIILYSLLNAGTDPVAAPITIDLTALGLAPAAVGRVVDLVAGRVIATTLRGSSLEITEPIPGDTGRLLNLHFAGAGAPVVLYAVKRGADVALTWSDGGRPIYEVLTGVARTLVGATLDVVTARSHDDVGAVPLAESRYYAVE